MAAIDHVCIQHLCFLQNSLLNGGASGLLQATNIPRASAVGAELSGEVPAI